MSAGLLQLHDVHLRRGARRILDGVTVQADRSALVALLKDSSLVSVLTVLELTKQTQIFATNIGSWVIPGTLCAALYLAMSLPISALARRLEQRWKTPSV